MARTFGVVLSRLNRECTSHLSVITGNQTVWHGKILPHFEKADAHVIARPIDLDGLNRAEAEALVQQRLKSIDAAVTPAVQTLLDELFEVRARIGARNVLKKASEWWTNTTVTPSIEDIFAAYRTKLLSQPEPLHYDAGVFRGFRRRYSV